MTNSAIDEEMWENHSRLTIKAQFKKKKGEVIIKKILLKEIDEYFIVSLV